MNEALNVHSTRQTKHRIEEKLRESQVKNGKIQVYSVRCDVSEVMRNDRTTHLDAAATS